MRERYGPAGGFPSSISSVTVKGAEARAGIEPSKLLVASVSPFTVSYDCALPGYVDVNSLLRGFQRGDAAFVPGMALFYRLHNQQAEYDANIEAAAICARQSRKAERATGESSLSIQADGNARLYLANERDLEQVYFVLGGVKMHTIGKVRFVHEAGFPYAVDGLLAAWPRLNETIECLFGDDGCAGWTVMLFATDEHAAGRPGIGFSLPQGALVSVSSHDERLATPHTLWLLLHERTHQWLGGAIARGSSVDDWFFEGFTNFVACETLTRTGFLPATERERLLSLSRNAVRRAKSLGDPAPAHEGFLGAERWHRHLLRQGGSLADVLARLVAVHWGETLGGESLRTALAQASPGRTLPAFIKDISGGASNEPA